MFENFFEKINLHYIAQVRWFVIPASIFILSDFCSNKLPEGKETSFIFLQNNGPDKCQNDHRPWVSNWDQVQTWLQSLNRLVLRISNRNFWLGLVSRAGIISYLNKFIPSLAYSFLFSPCIFRYSRVILGLSRQGCWTIILFFIY